MPSKPLPTLRDIDVLTTDSILFVTELLLESNQLRSRRDGANRKRISRLLKDPAAIDLTMSLTDEVMRISSLPQAAHALRRKVSLASISGLGIFDFLGIKLAAFLSYATYSKLLDFLGLQDEAAMRKFHTTKMTRENASSGRWRNEIDTPEFREAIESMNARLKSDNIY